MRRILILLLLLTGAANAACVRSFYIDYVGGADANNGTAKGTPWKRHPFMVGFTGTYSHAAADCFYFKGGVTWPNAVFPLIVTGSGNGTNGDYYGYDSTWDTSATVTGTVNTSGTTVTLTSGYGFLAAWAGSTITINSVSYTIASVQGVATLTLTGSAGTQTGVTYSFTGTTRPVFDAGGAVITGSGTANNFVRYSGAGSYTTWDSIEMKGFTWNTVTTPSQTSYMCFGCASSVTNVTIENMYFHGWTHTVVGTNGDTMRLMLGDSNAPYLGGSVITNNLMDNWDGNNDSGQGVYNMSGTMNGNVARNITNAFVTIGTLGNIYNNDISTLQSFDVNNHENAIEILRNASNTAGTWYVHDNNIHDMTHGESILTGWVNETVYVWNNLIWNIVSGNAPQLDSRWGKPTLMAYWNNLIVPQAGHNCFQQVQNVGTDSLGTVYIQNNHCITTANLYSIPLADSLTATPNTTQTPTTATSQGYTASQTPYVYFPTPGGSTIAAGTNLTSSATGTVASMTSDTTYAGTRTPNARPGGSTAWDTGPYMSVGASPFTLTTSCTGAGNGTITSTDINCTCTAGTGSGTCTKSYSSGATAATLTASASAGSVFNGWSGACAGAGTCAGLVMDSDKTATAAFDLLPTATLSSSLSVVKPGGTFTLTWGCTNSLSASIDQGVGAVSPTSGGTTSPITMTGTTTYILTCTAAGGTPQASVTVTQGGTVQSGATVRTGGTIVQ